MIQELSIADLERAQAYARDLGRGLKIIRTFPQGVTIFGSARLPQNNKYCVAARELGQKLAMNGHAVITGGGPGIMEAANHGAYEYGGRSIGLNITLSHEQFPNPYL
ncbi:TIGR00730 family Rossman fold protein, partial [Candidatus Saccharibacteria bacterium]|nr:TIGR00730 family Rossman fold protein [Candidatus Saccharibacteria bacterium]